MKKSIIFWAISILIIVVGVVMYFIGGFNGGVDFVGGTQVEVLFNKSVSEAEFNKYRTDIKNELEKAGYNVDFGRMLKSNKDITGVRFTFPEKVESISLNSIDSTMKVNTNTIVPMQNYASTMLWVTIVAVALVFVYVLIRNLHSNNVASAVTVAIVMLNDILLMLAINILLGKFFDVNVTNAFLAIIGMTAMLSAVYSVLQINAAKQEKCACKIIIAISVLAVAIAVAFGVLGYIDIAIQAIVAVAVVFYSSMLITGNTFKGLLKK